MIVMLALSSAARLYKPPPRPVAVLPVMVLSVILIVRLIPHAAAAAQDARPPVKVVS